MIVVSAAVKTDQTKPHQFLNFSRRRVNHTDNRLSFAFNFPVDQEQVRKHLNIIKHKFSIIVFCSRRLVGRFELHLIDQLNTVIRLMRAACGEGQHSVPHICNVIMKIACISVLKNFIDEVDTGFSCRMVFLVQIPFDLRSKTFLALHPFKIYHLLFSFQWQTRIDGCDGQVITLCQFPAQRAFAVENLNFNVVVIDSAQLCRIFRINIMQMNALPAFAQFRISGRPFTRLLQIQFKRLVSVLIRNIKVDNNMIFRNFDIVEFRRINTAQLRFYFLPFGCGDF